jgi:hypothetical protein
MRLRFASAILVAAGVLIAGIYLYSYYALRKGFAFSKADASRVVATVQAMQKFAESATPHPVPVRYAGAEPSAKESVLLEFRSALYRYKERFGVVPTEAADLEELTAKAHTSRDAEVTYRKLASECQFFSIADGSLLLNCDGLSEGQIRPVAARLSGDTKVEKFYCIGEHLVLRVAGGPRLPR